MRNHIILLKNVALRYNMYSHVASDCASTFYFQIVSANCYNWVGESIEWGRYQVCTYDQKYDFKNKFLNVN